MLSTLFFLLVDKKSKVSWQKMISVEKSGSSRLLYNILVIIAELLGLISVILVGLMFDEKYFLTGYSWEKSPFPYHPLMMTIGLLFCYGNAIILYRTFKGTAKLVVKIFHALLLLASLVFALVGLAAIIRNKNINNRPHFMTYHSWLGLTVLILFVFQWIVGFVTFLIPTTSLEIRRLYIPRSGTF